MNGLFIAANLATILAWIVAVGTHADGVLTGELFVADLEFAIALAISVSVVVAYRLYLKSPDDRSVGWAFQVSTTVVTLSGLFLCLDGVFASAFDQMFQSLLWIDILVGVILTIGAQFIAFDLGLWSIFGVERRD